TRRAAQLHRVRRWLHRDRSLHQYQLGQGWLVFRTLDSVKPLGLAKLVLGAKASPGAVAGDVVEREADRARAALDAVAGADQSLLLLDIPLVHPRRAEVGAVLALAVAGANGLVDDLDVGPPGVLFVLDGEELLGELLHAPQSIRRRSVPRRGTSAGSC